MARLTTAQYLNSRSEDNRVGRSTPYINPLTFPTNTRLQDDVFFSVSIQPYSRKEVNIYQFSDGINQNASTQEYAANVIHSERDCARFVPVVYPFEGESSVVENYQTKNSIDDYYMEVDYSEGYKANKIKMEPIEPPIYNGFNRTKRGEYQNTISFITEFDYKKWAVCPMLVGIYGDATVNVGSSPAIIMANPIAVSDYFIDPTTYPTTLTGYSGYNLLGFSLCFYMTGNFGDNTQGYGRCMFEDCGTEMDIPNRVNVLGACYAEWGLGTLYYSYNMVATYESEGIYSLIGKQALLGLVPQISNPFTSNYNNLSGAVFATPIFKTNMYNSVSSSYTNDTNIFQFAVIGNSEYIEWTSQDFHIGMSNSTSGDAPQCRERSIRSEIPIIKSEYLNEEFLLKVASQLGLPVIASREKVIEYDSMLNISSNFNKEWLLIPDINLETGFVGDEDPTPASELPEDDPRLSLINGTNAFLEVAIPDTSNIDPNHYTDNIELNSPNLDAIGKFNRYFAISESDIDDFVDFLYTSNASTISDIIDGLQLNGENPMNFLIGLRMFPFNIVEHSETTPQNIQFGNGVNTGVVGELITKFDAVIDLGSCEFRRYYGNYLDYEPYTTAKLYIPYCNEIDIPTSVFVGHTINVKLIVDITTGACCGVIFKDGIPCLYANGNIGIEIPITGENATEYVKQGLDAAIKAGSAAVQIAQNGAMMGKTGFTNSSINSHQHQTGNLTTTGTNESSGSTKTHQFSTGGIIGGVAQGLDAAYEFNYMPTALQTNGTSSPTTNLYKPQFCYFIVTSSIPLAPPGYGETIGYACMEKRNLEVDDGYVVIHNPNVQPANATSPETNEINQLLATGVWV